MHTSAPTAALPPNQQQAVPKGNPPRFAIQRAGQAKAKVVAIKQRLHCEEVITVTTMPDVYSAARLAHRLTWAWEGLGPFDPAAVPELASMPDAVAVAVADALIGCPTAPQDSVVGRHYELQIARIGVGFRAHHPDSDGGRMTGRQAARLYSELLEFAEDSSTSGEYAPDQIVDAADIHGMFEPERYVGLTASWWAAFDRGFHDLAADILRGAEPVPRTFAEAVALWAGLDEAEYQHTTTAPAGQAWRLDQDRTAAYVLQSHPADFDWAPVFERLIGSVARQLGCLPGTLHATSQDEFCLLLPPEHWHDLLPGALARDPARLIVPDL